MVGQRVVAGSFVVSLVATLSFASIVLSVPAASADCHGSWPPCPAKCPVGTATKCGFAKDDITSVIGGLRIVANLHGGHAIAGKAAAPEPVAFNVGDTGRVDFFVTDADGNPFTNSTVNVRIRVQSIAAGALTWSGATLSNTNYNAFTVPSGGGNATAPPPPTATFPFTVNTLGVPATELRFIVETTQSAGQEAEQMAFLLEVVGPAVATSPGGMPSPWPFASLAVAVLIARRLRRS